MLFLVPTDQGYAVRCADCGRELDTVNDERTAYLRAGQYIHECKPDGTVL